jgi:UDP-galactopyranose mutase
MPFDYDLLVIGSSLAGTLTAIRAAHYRARVAIVRRELRVDINVFVCMFLYIYRCTYRQLIFTVIQEKQRLLFCSIFHS